MTDFAIFVNKRISTCHTDDIFGEKGELSPLAHVREYNDRWELSMDLPLVEKKDIHVSISENHIMVRAKLKESITITKDNRNTEFEYFKKIVNIPVGLEKNSITAKFKNGILNITITKESDGETIQIE